MSDVATIVPQLSVRPFAHILPSLERAGLCTADLLSLDALDVAKRASVPAKEVRRLVDALLSALHASLSNDGTPSNTASTGPSRGPSAVAAVPSISLLDDMLDRQIGPVPIGYLTEVTGESGVGKTQLLLTLLLAVQLPPPLGLSKKAIYISTESSLMTSRLVGLLDHHPALATVEHGQKPSLSNILSIKCPDLQTQDHILHYQLPVAVKRHNVGLVVIDSITANYRAEIDRRDGKGLADRTAMLQQIGKLLRDLAIEAECAVVVANQVSDRFEVDHLAPNAALMPFASSAESETNEAEDDFPTMTLDHQQRWFTGWGDDMNDTALKTPSLGMVWANQISSRIALTKVPASRRDGAGSGGRRRIKLVFAPWATGSSSAEFEIGQAGLRGLQPAASHAR